MKTILTTVMLASMIGHGNAEEMFVKKSFFSRHEAVVEERQPVGEIKTVGGYPIINFGVDLMHLLSNVSRSKGPGENVKMGRTIMFASKESKHHVSVDMLVNLEQANISNWTDTPCKRDDYIWKKAIGGKVSNENCVTINHVVDYFKNPTGRFQQVAVWAKRENYQFPPTIIRVTFTRFNKGGRFLRYVVDINPELYGVERDATTPWGSSGWYKDFIEQYEVRKDFIEKLKVWAIDVQGAMDEAFNKNGNAFKGIKPIDEYFGKVAVNKSNEESKTSMNVESQLKELKGLYEKNLITDEIYKDKIRQVINSKGE